MVASRTPSEPSLQQAVSGPPEQEHFDPRALPVYNLYRRLRSLVLSAGDVPDPEELARRVLRALVDPEPTDVPAAVLGGRVYRRHASDLELIDKVGAAGPAPLGYRVPLSYPIVQEALKTGWALVQRADPRIDPEIEAPVGDEAFAVIVIGPSQRVLLSLSLREPVAEVDLAYAIATLRTIADMTLRKQELAQSIEQARRVQTSLLPTVLDVPEGYEIVVRSRPAEIVGGDIYDVTHMPPDIFALTVGDAIGHGLPAALLARDAIVGLRVTIAERLKMVAAFETLTRVLTRSGPPGRFISLFYAEIDREGNLIYLNAGHVPPLIIGLTSGRLVRLPSTGPVLGVELALSEGYYRRFQSLESGDVLVLYTDGLIEAAAPTGEEFGEERLIEAVRKADDKALDLTTEQIFAEVEAFSMRSEPLDDQTLLLLRRQ